MRMTVELPDDLLEKLAVDALKKRRNSKTLVITEILRAHYRAKARASVPPRALRWRIPSTAARQIQLLRQRTKTQWV